MYPLMLIPCRKGNWLHVGSNPTLSTEVYSNCMDHQKKTNFRMKKWNSQDWQGRRKDQYESSARIVFICTVINITITVSLLLDKFL